MNCFVLLRMVPDMVEELQVAGDGSGITATVADVRFGPDFIEVPAKLPPSATIFWRAISGGRARCVSSTGGVHDVEPRTIMNGVKQQWFGLRFPGVELT